MPKVNPLRNFVFTINNYDDDSLNDLKEFDKVKYLVAGREVGENGTPHLQGYCELKAQVSFNTIKDLIPTAHIEKPRKCAQANIRYCKKDGDVFVEMGTAKQPGKRTDIDDAIEMLNDGATMKEMAIQNPAPYVKYHRGLEKYKMLLIPDRTEPPEVIVLFGPTGCGKSRKAREICDPDPYVWYPSQANGGWFDGYEGQRDTIMEEFRGQLPFGTMLSLLDRYTCRVPTKGGFANFSSSRIVITSPQHPREWYENLDNNDKLEQLLRRITSIQDIKGLKEKNLRMYYNNNGLQECQQDL